MAFLRKTLSVAVITVLAFSASGPVMAGVVHRACAAKHHGCAHEIQLTQCCCGEHGDVTNAANVPPAGAGIIGDECTAVLCLFCTVATPSAHVGFEQSDNAPPLAHPLDLPILFADLRL